MIARKLALRIWSACLLSQADHLEDLATGAEFADRFEVLEADARDQWYRDGYEAGRATRG